MTGRGALGACLGLALLAWATGAAQAQTAVPVVINGDAANRLDLVFLGDGYTESEMDRFAKDVNQAATGLLAQDPFREYQRYVNIRRVEVASVESGASHPTRGISRNTAFGAYYGCGGLERLICVTTSKVISTVQAALTPSERDLVIVLVNDSEYGGSGGSVVVASGHAQAVELVLHELGHTFGLLRDEYGGPPPPACNDTVEPTGANATKETERDKIKWTHWIDPSTPLPTTTTTNGVPGLFAGAVYCDSTLFRPVYNSKMRSLNMPWWQINTEQIIKRFYTFVDPIDSVTPDPSKTVAVGAGQSQRFAVTFPSPATRALSLGWWLDGRLVGTGSEFVVAAGQVTDGFHALQVVVADPTPSVREDPDALLRSQAAWSVTVGAFSDGFALSADRDAITVLRGQPSAVGLTLTPASGAFSAAVSLSCSGLPAPAQCRVSPSAIAAGAARTSATLTLVTVASGLAPGAALPAGVTGAFGAAVAGLSLFALPFVSSHPRRRRVAVAAVVVTVVCGLAMVACGGSSSGSSAPPRTTDPGTPAGTYPVVVTATSGDVSRTVTVAVTVQ